MDTPRLYVWHDVFRDYSAGIAFCIARSKEEAIVTMLDAVEPWERHQIHTDPDVYDAPYADHIHGGG